MLAPLLLLLDFFRLLYALLLGSEVAVQAGTPFSVVGYVPEWRFDRIPFESISPHLTHLILFSVETDANANLVEMDRLPSFSRMEAIRSITKQSDTQLLVSFAGFGRSNGFPIISISQTLRHKFVENVVALMDQYHLDGIDLNWEYPQNEREWIGLFQIIKRFKVRRPTMTLTMAFYPGQEQVIVSPVAQQHGVAENIDLFLMMSYDNMKKTGTSKHSTLEFAMKTVNDALEAGIQNLALGLPFYARNIKTGDWKTYEHIVREWRHDGDGDVVEMKKRDIAGDFYYNSYDTISKKTRYALRSGIRGIMIWENGQDVHDDPLSLLGAITETIKEYRAQQGGHEEL